MFRLNDLKTVINTEKNNEKYRVKFLACCKSRLSRVVLKNFNRRSFLTISDNSTLKITKYLYYN